MRSEITEAARAAISFVPGLGAGAETIRQEARRGTNPVAIALEATWDSFLNLTLPGTEAALKNVEAEHVRNRRGGRESEEFPTGQFAVVAALDAAFSLTKVAATSTVIQLVGPEAGIATFVLLHELQEKAGLDVTIALLEKTLKPSMA